jgi:hypothetical protein
MRHRVLTTVNMELTAFKDVTLYCGRKLNILHELLPSLSGKNRGVIETNAGNLAKMRLYTFKFQETGIALSS